jgi:tRNA G10  N-methylase Trm11
MKYFFVLGRNPILSKAEILSYFEKENISLKENSLKSNGLVVEVDKELNLKEMMSELGGTIAIGKVLFSEKIENLKKEIENKTIYFGRENKVVYSFLDYASEEDSSEILDAMKNNFSKERLKARYKGVSGTIKMQTGEVLHGSPEKIMRRDMNYFLFSEEKSGKLNFGYLEESYDSAEAEKKDMEKPYRRESLAISPRLARILINLSQVKKNGLLLDPFCGIGVIVGEALLKGIDVIGVDIDKSATESAKKNIEWLKNKYKLENKSIIINKDSREVRIDKADGIATEPSLGELMTRNPTREKAQQIINTFENLMIEVLNNVKKGLKRDSKVAFSAPLIKSQSGRISCNVESICENTGFSVYSLGDITFPIREFRPDQIVGRDIFVLSV